MEGMFCLYGQSMMNHISLKNEAVDIIDFTRHILANDFIRCTHELIRWELCTCQCAYSGTKLLHVLKLVARRTETRK